MPIKHVSTHFLRFALVVITIAVLALCVLGLPSVWMNAVRAMRYEPLIPSSTRALVAISIRAIIINLYITAVPFFVALHQTFKLLGNIDQRKAFSESSVEAIRAIKYCAVAIALFYIANVPLLYPFAELDDAPGVLVVGMGIAGAPIVVAVFASVLEKLLRSAIDLQHEHDLTV